MNDGEDVPREEGSAAESAKPQAAPAESNGARAGGRRIHPKSPRQAIQPEPASPPPPRSRQAKHPLVVTLNFFLMIAVLAALFAGGALYFGKQRFLADGPLEQPKTILITRGSGVDTIAKQLKRNNVIDSEIVFTVGVRLYEAASRLQYGEYLFEPHVSMREVMEILSSGKAILHSVTIPEGLTSLQVVDRLKASDVLTGNIETVPPEGSLLPETYKFTRGTTRQQILDQMTRAHNRLVDEIWKRREPGLPVADKKEFVTLASIVEKETGKADERPRVAAVFINRLKRGMRLQSDPTIIYGLFGGEGKPSDRPILRSDIDKPTDYNTYQIQGLPPGPIANPGRAAMEAVSSPSHTDDLYFVADGTGGHVFSSTLDEHNRNVARWRRIERTQQEVAEQKAAEAPQETADAGPGDLLAEEATAGADPLIPRPRPQPE
ncbi:endolytic transglycosylase MltG [Afifella sp. IM 167]|uniref:endolytic transglycosylase MltG n=1 Tax=Afifella sp. IM 167 TaxID=2033586 RepID=UPI001CCE33B6|nr:endolytic transglycosylase MltG [Afifella sp. IM 167]MBZ8131730.1 4-amino-4-deoxychorismate lyase [Afifella sp. IM 167]